jgi:hypothetical protein
MTIFSAKIDTIHKLVMASSTPQPGTVESPVSADQLTCSKWAKPEFKLPVPSLQFLFHLECDMESFRHIGAGPHGDRSTVIFKGGRFEGPRLRGSILPGGGGKQHHHPVPLLVTNQKKARFVLTFVSPFRLGDCTRSRW